MTISTWASCPWKRAHFASTPCLPQQYSSSADSSFPLSSIPVPWANLQWRTGLCALRLPSLQGVPTGAVTVPFARAETSRWAARRLYSSARGPQSPPLRFQPTHGSDTIVGGADRPRRGPDRLRRRSPRRWWRAYRAAPSPRRPLQLRRFLSRLASAARPPCDIL